MKPLYATNPLICILNQDARMEVRNVSLDTQFIISQNYLQGNLLNELAIHSKHHRITITITDIVYNEVLRHFRMAIVEAKSKNTRNQAAKLYVLRHFKDYEGYFTLPEIDIEKLFAAFSSMWDSWISDHKILVLDTRELSIGEVFNDYFERRPPFEQQKKEEFPDAFNIARLKEYFTNRAEKCFLISGDTGVKKYKSDVLITDVEAKDILESIVRIEKGDANVDFIETEFRKQLDEVMELCEEVLFDIIKEDTLIAYISNGQHITELLSYGVKVLNVAGDRGDVVHISKNAFELIITINGRAYAEVVMKNVVDNGNPQRMDLELFFTTDVAIPGTFDRESKSVILGNFSFSPPVVTKERRHPMASDFD